MKHYWNDTCHTYSYEYGDNRSYYWTMSINFENIRHKIQIHKFAQSIFVHELIKQTKNKILYFKDGYKDLIRTH